MTKEQLEEILANHLKWLNNEEGGERANLRGANLRGANLRGANLSGAILSRADLRWANLSGAILSRADLSWANLSGAILSRADLSWANLSWADLHGADLSRANLRGANLRGANLSGAKNIEKAITDAHTAFFGLQCPEKGSYTAFKKAQGLIVELEIPADALRSSATSRKCRASKAKVISISDTDGNPAGEQVPSDYDDDFVYVVGQTVEIENFDTNRWNECSNGIHHYITRAEAVNHR